MKLDVYIKGERDDEGDSYLIWWVLGEGLGFLDVHQQDIIFQMTC